MIKIDKERLDEKDIQRIVSEYDFNRFKRNLKYYNGLNPSIMDRVVPVSAADIKVPIPYGRKIINTVTGYMYKPGLISYGDLPDKLQEIFYDNKEPIKTAELGKQTSLQGVGYEVHYLEGGNKIKPRFAKVPAANIIPLYNYDIEPKLVAFIFIENMDDDTIYKVYYNDVVEVFATDGKNNRQVYRIPSEDFVHMYSDVPLVVYENNEEQLGDIEPVVPLIDAYDRLMSDSMNENDRFAYAYMVFKGYDVANNVEEIEAMKHLRAFGVTEDGAIDFLTKDIPSDFISFMAKWIRGEIHKQSHVPDFLEAGATGDALSGVAIDKLLYDFEFIASTKEALFEHGLRRRIELISTIRPGAEVQEIEIVFDRNKPEYLSELADTMQKYAGHVSEETLLTNFAPFVEDVEIELSKMEEEGNLYEPSTREDIQTDSEDRE